MRTYLTVFSLAVGLALWPLAQHAVAEEHDRGEHEGRLLLAEIDREVLAEQYRHLQMEAFKAGLELGMARLKHKFGPEGQADAAGENWLMLHKERLGLLERLIEEKREQIIMLHVKWTELETAARPEHEIEGIWIGRDMENNAAIRLRVKGEHARFECPSEGTWYEGNLRIEPEGEDLWDVSFQIEECAQPRYRGKTSRGLARLQGDRFVLAANEPGIPDRPASLKQSNETKLFVFERE